MHVTYVREASLGSRLDGLTYGELKGMVPAVTNTKKLPDPRTIESTCKNNILVTASDEFTSLVLFDNGIYKYAEYGHATSFSVNETPALSLRNQSTAEPEEFLLTATHVSITLPPGTVRSKRISITPVPLPSAVINA